MITLAAQMLGMSRQAVHQMARRGVIGARWVRGTGPGGGVVIVSEEDVRRQALLRGGVVTILPASEAPIPAVA
jgi:hypothetical protein